MVCLTVAVMLRNRVARLDARHPARTNSPLLDVSRRPADLLARITQTKAAGAFPHSVATLDPAALVTLADQPWAT